MFRSRRCWWLRWPPRYARTARRVTHHRFIQIWISIRRREEIESASRFAIVVGIVTGWSRRMNRDQPTQILIDSIAIAAPVAIHLVVNRSCAVRRRRAQRKHPQSSLSQSARGDRARRPHGFRDRVRGDTRHVAARFVVSLRESFDARHLLHRRVPRDVRLLHEFDNFIDGLALEPIFRFVSSGR